MKSGTRASAALWMAARTCLGRIAVLIATGAFSTAYGAIPSIERDALMALPDYTKTERRKTAPPETATVPPARPTPAPPR